MKNKIFMYLFFFAVLFIIFQYMNEKSIFESQQKEINALTNLKTENDSVMNVMADQLAEAQVFNLNGNDNAMTYLENLGYEVGEVQDLVSEAIYEANFQDPNPLITVTSQDGKMRINKLRFLNHRWIIADFSDGQYWGEVIIDYFFDDQNQLQLTPVTTVMYPN